MNGKPCDPSAFRSQSAYIRQEDIMFETMTPRELFTFSARMRLPRTATDEDRTAAVERTIKVLGLEKCADTRVGGALQRGISGGERKRTNIGQELVTDPAILFVDGMSLFPEMCWWSGILLHRHRTNEWIRFCYRRTCGCKPSLVGTNGQNHHLYNSSTKLRRV